MSEVNLFELALNDDDDDPAGYHVLYQRVGPLIGAEQLGLSVYGLPPGQSVCPYHYEVGFEEWLVVLVGTPTLRTPEGEEQLRPWDVAFFPDGEDGAHKVTNHTEEPVRIAILSNKTATGRRGVSRLEQDRRLAAEQALPPGRRRRLLGRRALASPPAARPARAAGDTSRRQTSATKV